MKKNLWWLMVVIVFVVGLLVSNMLAQAKENVTEVQWEYKTVSTEYKRGVKQQIKQDLLMLNEHGKAGWELCGVSNIIYYFKREIKE
jgi:hypothetical protein